ncbi:hypothetical protein F5Y19DRAFT_4047 [Xylariaceae sp. FL1651]|nr:hypothetical protein F5Y19DRAFT_4047 [Xylariaceae sp. FL1651]
MYAGNYGYPNNAAGSPPYNGGAPPPGSQNSAMQPGAAPNQMMYNAQQFPMGAQSAAAFPGNPNMMPGVGPAGMMQNTGMPHMAAANGQMPNYQPPYSNPPYGAGVPSPVPPQMSMPQNYAMGGSMPMGGFPMQQGMNPRQQQQMMQRMQASQANVGMPTPPQRNFQTQPPQGTPTPSNGQVPQQSQFSGPQNTQGPHQGQLSNTPQQQAQAQISSLNNVATPQTPTFPTPTQGNSTNGTSSGSTPLSPGADPKDKDRVGVILEINNELLLEAMQIQGTQQIIRKERATVNGTDSNTNDGEKKTTEDEQLAQDYIQCMRRLQTNLAYLAALADKEKRPAQPYPAYLKAPTLNTSIKLRQPQAPDGTENKTEIPDREETVKYIGELYKKLQALYPGIDPNKEPNFQISGSGRPAAQAPNSTQSGSQTPGQASPVPGKQPTPTLASSAPPQSMMSGVTAP